MRLRVRLEHGRVLPASAGMIPYRYKDVTVLPSAPRIRGDDPTGISMTTWGEKCSPHPRG